MSTSISNPIITLLFGLTFGTGCVEEESQDSSKDEICGGHGEMHGSHCHCDSGYSLTDDGLSCELDSEPESVDYGGDFVFEPTEINASTGTSDNSQIWLLEAIDDDVHLKIEIYESYGGISAPGSITLEEVETNYATCGTCILIQTGCELHGDHYHCERTFMPVAGGEVHIEKIGTSADDEFAGELLGIKFQEVTIAQDYETERVADGEEIHLVPWSFQTQLDEF